MLGGGVNVDTCNSGSPQDAPLPPPVSTLATLLGAIDLFTCALLTASH